MEITPDVNVHIEIPTASTSPTTGALTIVGGVGIEGDVNIAGNISFGGSGTSTTTNNLAVEASMIYLGDGNPADALDLGVVGEYVTGGNTKYAGLVRDASDGVIKFFKGATTKPTSTVNFAEAGLLYSDVKVSTLYADYANIGDVSNIELQYLNGVTSAVQTQLDDKVSLGTSGSSQQITGEVIFYSVGADLKLPDKVRDSLGNYSSSGKVLGRGQFGAAWVTPRQAGIWPYPDRAGQVLITDVDGVASWSSSLDKPVFTSPLETVTVSATAATGTVNVDISTSAVKYYTSNSSADWTFNFRGDGSTTLNSLMAIGQAITVAFLVTNGSTAYKPTVFQVDGSAVTPKWSGGSAPAAGSVNSIDSYTFTIIKTASATFTVLGAQSKFA
jgi:hypothetical protein